MKSVLTNEKTLPVSPVGSALEADKKINLAIKISVNVEVAEASRATTEGRPVNDRRDHLYSASGLSLARPSSHIWTLELCLYPVATLVHSGVMGQIVASAGPEGAGNVALFGRQPYQGTSGWEQPRWRPTKSGHWAYQGRSEYQAQCLGGYGGTSDQCEPGCWTSRRGNHGTSIRAASVARKSNGCRQSLRQRWLSGTVAAMGKPRLHSTSQQSPSASQLAPRLLPQTSQSRKLIPTPETLSPNRNTI